MTSYWYKGQSGRGVSVAGNSTGSDSYWVGGQVDNWFITSSDITLSADNGTYSLSGQNASFHFTRNIAAAKGAYALSGQSAALRFSATGVFSPGSYSLTGYDVGLSTHRGIATDTGVYLLTGVSAAGHKFRTMSALTGYYDIYGQPAALARNTFHATFAEFTNPTFEDWQRADYTSYLEVIQSLQDPSLRTQTPYIYTFLKQDTTSRASTEGATLEAKWDWVSSGPRITPPEDIYSYRAGMLTSVKKTKIRGQGRGIKLKYTSVSARNFNLLGWVVFYDTNAGQ